MTFNINRKTLQEIGKNFRDTREQKHLLQEEVANAAGISVTYYAGIERGEENLTLAVIQNLCDVLDIMVPIKPSGQIKPL